MNQIQRKTTPMAIEDTESSPATRMRLSRFLARAGIASRRKSDEMIQSGVVHVNGELVIAPAYQVESGKDKIECQGVPVNLPDAFEYIVMDKPTDCLVTCSDTHGRPTVFERIDNLHPGTVAVGRLDMDTTGLLLLTDDGELAYRLTHPRFEVDKRYKAVVDGKPTEETLDRLRAGIELDDGPTSPAWIERGKTRRKGYHVETELTLVIHEGRKRQIRRMLSTVGHKVRQLRRVSFAGLELDLPRFGWRHLTPDEVKGLKKQVGLGEEKNAECADKTD